LEDATQTLTPEARRQLFQIARDSIAAEFRGTRHRPPRPEDPQLLQPGGAFVSIHAGEALRGCIGLLEAEEPLYLTIASMARSAAFDDPRFPPLRQEELAEVDLEISVLSPLQKLDDPSEVEVGRHGLYILKGGRRGVLLPQVAPQQGWDRRRFLEETCHKAGLPRDAWKKKAKIYMFTATVFEEGER
jgi:AmmeMemoRadiSam system protein A